ncbi:MAG TPA: hypothetical protein VI409_08810 [Gaiellaceae bacterium]|nr:hypothetical protein [Gaiellaceae bacterium]
MASDASVAEDGIATQATRRRANERKAAGANPATDPQGLVEFACECNRVDCERSVKVPLYVYRRMVAADDQYLLQAGHHAFTTYRTIVTIGLMRIEERA